MTYTDDNQYFAAYTYGLERIEVEALDETRPESQDPLYYLYDGLGSVAYMVKPDGNTRDHYNYDEYGKPAPGNSKLSPDGAINLHNTFGYTGEMWDEESKLLYLRARYYEPETGRFLSRDTYEGELTNPLSKNLYSYVQNNPVNRIDPFGHDAIIITARAGAYWQGHTSLLIEDASGRWYYTFWGDKKVVVEEIKDKNALTSLKNLNAWVQKDVNASQYYDKSYTSSTYIQGDFTKSLKYLEKLEDAYETKYGLGQLNGDYSLWSNNCLQQSYKALLLGKFYDGTKVSDYAPATVNRRPNTAARQLKDLFKNNAFTLRDFKSQLENYIKLNEARLKDFWAPYKKEYQENIDEAKMLLTPKP